MIPLVAHPSTPAGGARVAARLERTADGLLRIGYRLDGALDDLVVPPPGPGGRGDRLWEHTCCEAFLGLDGAPAYLELNFSPAGTWAAYAFASYRAGAPLALDPAPSVTVRRSGAALELEALVDGRRLPGAYARAALRVGLSAVLEARAGMLSYWALRHPSGRPDFHHADAFALALEATA